MRKVFSLVAASAILFGISSLATAGVLDVSYTDNWGNVANLALTYTPLGGGADEVTEVTGTWAGQAITAGPLTDPAWGTLSNDFYADPSMLPAYTLDTGFLFETASNYVEFYQYNWGSSGFAETTADLSYENLESGGAAGVTVVDAVPEPGPGLLLLTAVGLCVASRLLRRPSRA